jgi:hypothetical protein
VSALIPASVDTASLIIASPQSEAPGDPARSPADHDPEEGERQPIGRVCSATALALEHAQGAAPTS